jgi:lipopolysaccharide transport system permease protein
MFHNLSPLPRYRGLIQSLVARELKARYRGSMLGFFWSFVNPLLLLLVYSFVFSVVLKNQSKTQPYSIFLFCGILPWTWFSSSVLESSGVLIAGGNLIKKVLFPAEVLPIVTVVANMVHFILGLPILLLFMIYFRVVPTGPNTVVNGMLVPPDPSWFPMPNLGDLWWLPIVILIQLIFTIGIAFIVSSLTVHFRDLKDILGNLMTFWFFATPIIYDMSQFDNKPWGKTLIDLNPFTHFALSYQELLFYDGPFGHWKWLVAIGVLSVVVFLLGYFLFDRLRDTFAEEV